MVIALLIGSSFVSESPWNTLLFVVIPADHDNVFKYLRLPCTCKLHRFFIAYCAPYSSCILYHMCTPTEAMMTATAGTSLHPSALTSRFLPPVDLPFAKSMQHRGMPFSSTKMGQSAVSQVGQWALTGVRSPSASEWKAAFKHRNHPRHGFIHVDQATAQ
jgi:hypothetical protein